MIVQWLKANWHEHLIKHSKIRDSEWQDAFQKLSLLHRLNEAEKTRLKQLAILFLHYKSLEGVDLEITSEIKVIIALQACLPILNLGLAWYKGWVSLIIYPGAFARQSKEVDDCGVVHEGRVSLSGEAWQRGSVVLSWHDAFHEGKDDGRNVVIHELAHKLDMLNGRANGLPPLHHGILVEEWARVFNQAYADFTSRIHQGAPIPINDYAATSPAEFFAVFSEVFFEKPEILLQYYPEVYQLLVRFYCQDPIHLLSTCTHTCS